MIIGGSASQDLAAHVAKELGEELCYVEIKKFPDGEKYLRINGTIEDEDGYKIGCVRSDGTVEDKDGYRIGYVRSDGTVEDKDGYKIGETSGMSKENAAYYYFFK